MTRSESLGRFKNILRSQFATGPRYCTQCRCQRPRSGGREVKMNNGRNARWVCGMHKSEGWDG